MTQQSQPDSMQGMIPMGDNDPFDEEAFANEMVEGVGSTTVTPIPAGDYFATIGDKIKLSPFSRKDTGEPGALINVPFLIVDDSGAIKAAIDGRDPIHYESYFLDVTRNSQGKIVLDMGKGKNTKLNRLREAVGQNTGAAWSYPMLCGAGPLKIKIGVGPDKNDKELMRNHLKAVGKLA